MNLIPKSMTGFGHGVSLGPRYQERIRETRNRENTFTCSEGCASPICRIKIKNIKIEKDGKNEKRKARNSLEEMPVTVELKEQESAGKVSDQRQE